MKKVEAEVRKERFPEVDFALKRIGVPGLTVAEEQRAGRGMWAYPMENIKHLILTVVVDDAGVRKVVESIRGSARTRFVGRRKDSGQHDRGRLRHRLGTGLTGTSSRCPR